MPEMFEDATRSAKDGSLSFEGFGEYAYLDREPVGSFVSGVEGMLHRYVLDKEKSEIGRVVYKNVGRWFPWMG